MKTASAALGIVMLLGACSPEGDSDTEVSSCEDISGFVLDDAQVDVAAEVSEGDELSMPGSQELIQDMPELCRVQGTATPVDGSHIGFEVWLPKEWTGRIHMVGNGGYSSTMNAGLMRSLAEGSDVAVATDTGHTGDDLSFGRDNVEAQVDWGHRAVHESIVAAKEIVRSFYGGQAEYTYFSGCSTGGHQGLMEAQRYPNDFDGIIAGAPGNNRTNLNLGFLWQFLSNHEPEGGSETILNSADLQEINRAFVDHYDERDGVEDGVIADPSDLEFDAKVLEQEGVSLTDQQIDALEAMYQGPEHRRTGETLYPGWPVGSEWIENDEGGAGWDQYWADPERPAEPSRADFFRHWVFEDPEWDWWEFDWDEDVDRVHSQVGSIVDATDPDLRDFQESGGKLLMFTGWQDPVVSATDVIDYYQQVVDESGSIDSAQEFARLFMVPGMGHCGGGPGATVFSSSTQGVEPLRDDAQHNLIRALESWVEEGVAPEQMVASHFDDEGEPEFTRALCPHPQTGVHRSGGDEAKAASFECSDE
ncbi:tannase/feruloyl esterase family alpha/beta hydrolase [Brevibacterium yomogidense]|uniref:tannase/feruloyl esterase family alpha/beta hydrolase n=1 Tax=Brevibacterium yomogidense TaxID=946573 RepID=UPI0018E0326C|nr:tannase/feruloyl esterase family alpha/beta hydrolase [Brevibacterium yomogidense]